MLRNCRATRTAYLHMSFVIDRELSEVEVSLLSSVELLINYYETLPSTLYASCICYNCTNTFLYYISARLIVLEFISTLTYFLNIFVLTVLFELVNFRFRVITFLFLEIYIDIALNIT